MSVKFDIATDMDDVIVNISEPWIKKILADKGLCDRMSKDFVENACSAHPANRPAYPILSHFSSNHSQEFNEEMSNLLHDLYFKDGNFYDELLPSQYYHYLCTMRDYGVLRSVSIVSSCVELAYPVTASKIRYLNKLFDSFRAQGIIVRFIFTEKKETKAQAINGSNVEYGTFVDDAIFNIVDVVQNTPSTNKEFMIPRYRHNLVIPESRELVLKHGVRFMWFDNDLLLNQDRLADRRRPHNLPDGKELVWDR